MLKVLCRQCGKEYAVTNKFCPFCGHIKETFICSRCGAKYGVNSKGYSHCKKCGGNIVSDQANNVVVEKAETKEQPKPQGQIAIDEEERKDFYKYHEKHIYGWRIFSGIVCLLSAISNFVSIPSISADYEALIVFSGLLGIAELITGILFLSSATATKKCSIALIVFASITLVFGFITLNPAHFAGSAFHIGIGVYLIRSYGRIERLFNAEYYYADKDQ